MSPTNNFLISAREIANNVALLTETVCNVGACVPVAGFAFIAFHGGLGYFQVTKGLACAVIGKLGELFAEHAGCDDEFIHTFFLVKEFGKEHLEHGLLNIVQATQQAVIGIFTLNLGNLVVPIYREGFGPHYTYDNIGK
jgi:hypothetical protein